MIPYNCLNYDNTMVTVELRELIQNGVDVWAFDYPSYYKDDAKKAFEKKVIDHFFFRQIGMETPGRWLHAFRTRVREIMPYYIQLYESEDLLKSVEDPFEAYNLREEYTRQHTSRGSSQGTSETESELDGSSTGEGSQTSTDNRTNTGTTNNTKKRSDTPQGSIDNIDKYMTEATVENGEASETVTGTQTDATNDTRTDHQTGATSGTSSTATEDEGSETYTLTRKGNIGVQPLGYELKALREAFLNIDMMIINELNDLFLKVY